MSLFQDKKFEELDWLSQITETIDSSINNALSAMPEEITLTYQEVFEGWSSSFHGRNINTEKFLRTILYNVCREKNINLSYEENDKIYGCYVFKVADNTVLNFENQTLTGQISLVKKVYAFEDEFLQKNMGKGAEQLYWTKISRSPGRAREIAKLLDLNVSPEILKSSRKLGSFISNTMRRILMNNEWRIRSTDLADKACLWIIAYIEDGCRASYSNFCRLKVMTHSGGPIYSIEEEK